MGQWEWKVTVEYTDEGRYMLARVWERQLLGDEATAWKLVGIGGAWTRLWLGRYKQCRNAAIKNAGIR